jgi:hypothetical protein
MSNHGREAGVSISPGHTAAIRYGVDLAPEPLYEEARRNLAKSASSAR